MLLRIILNVILLQVYSNAVAQQPRYTHKQFVTTLDTSVFKYIRPLKNGFSRSYLLTHVSFYDLDDDSTTFINLNDSVLLCIEGQVINNKREGVYRFSLIDKVNHAKRYRIWEQTFKNDRLHGEWRTYTLRGGLFGFTTFKNNNLHGPGKNYWIDGKKVQEETEYFGSELNYVYKNYYDNNITKSELAYKNGKLEGICKKYYQSGVLQEFAEFKNGEFHGRRKYYYENGQLWIENIYKDGKNWEIIANYSWDGKKREAGTLKNGNGTILFYNEDGSFRETETYVNGILEK